MKYLFIISIMLFLISCSSNQDKKIVTAPDRLELVPEPDKNQKKEIVNSNDSPTSEKITIPQNQPWKPDSLELAFLEGKYFSKYFIRLSPNESAFIFIDSNYVANYIDDPILRQEFFHTYTLTPENRESFYEKIISAIPKEDIRIHQLIWNIKELKGEGPINKSDTISQSDTIKESGMYEIATCITKRPNDKEAYYSISVIRDFGYAIRPWFTIPYLRIYPKGDKIYVDDLFNEGPIPIEKWRELQK